jgi:prepilin-type N-terminal cleavage/methylation domain-containing protein
MKRHSNHGWTLIELLTVIIILAVVGTVGARLMSSMFRSYFTARDITSSDAQARVAFERMTRELRQIRSPTATDLDVASTAQVRFIDMDGNGVCFYRDAANNRLMRSADGPTSACGTTSAQPLSDFVSNLFFRYYTTDGNTTTAAPTAVYYVTVHVDVQDNDVSDTLRATIHPRNF